MREERKPKMLGPLGGMIHMSKEEKKRGMRKLKNKQGTRKFQREGRSSERHEEGDSHLEKKLPSASLRKGQRKGKRAGDRFQVLIKVACITSPSEGPSSSLWEGGRKKDARSGGKRMLEEGIFVVGSSQGGE